MVPAEEERPFQGEDEDRVAHPGGEELLKIRVPAHIRRSFPRGEVAQDLEGSFGVSGVGARGRQERHECGEREAAITVGDADPARRGGESLGAGGVALPEREDNGPGEGEGLESQGGARGPEGLKGGGVDEDGGVLGEGLLENAPVVDAQQFAPAGLFEGLREERGGLPWHCDRSRRRLRREERREDERACEDEGEEHSLPGAHGQASRTRPCCTSPPEARPNALSASSTTMYPEDMA